MGELALTSNRLDGWKAVGLYLGRERTTVIRWARTRDLPVHRMPGGKKATVYAFKDELDQWVRSMAADPAIGDPADSKATAPAPVASPVRPPPRARAMLLWCGAALVLALALTGMASWSGAWRSAPVAALSPATALPRDAESARLYLQARDDWALRTPQGLDRAIAALERVTAREPDFALAYSGLADSFLLAREFGAMRDVEAFSRARIAAAKALKLDPGQAPAHRALGFIHYWWDRDPKAAGEAFRRAVSLDPASAQSHFWYGNILSDNGEHAAALRELDRARMIEPGSVAIQSDLGFALWAAGRAEGIARLDRLALAQPGFAGIHDCLSEIRLAQGDYAGFVREYARMVRLRGDPGRIADVAALETALAQGVPALQARLMADAVRDVARNDRVDHVWPAFLASVARDRARLLAVLATADRRQEEWGNAGLTRRIAAAWAGDPAILALLAARRAPRIER